MAMQPNKRGPDDYTSPLVGKHPRRTVNPYEEIAARVRKVAQDCLARAPPSAEPPHLRPQVLPCTPAHTAGLDLDAQLYKPISSPVATKFVETFVTSKEILLDSARRQRTIVPFTDHAASTEYLTRHVPLVCLTTISADDVKRMGLRERFPDEHGTTNKRPTPGQYTRMCLLLSFQNRDLVVRSHKLKDVNHNPKNVWPDPSKPVPGFSYSEDRLTGMNLDIVTAPPATGKTGVTIEAALAVYRGDLLPRILRDIDNWSVQIRATSALGVYRADTSLRPARPCQLAVIVAPDNVMTYWHNTLANAIVGDANFTIYPTRAADKLITARLDELFKTFLAERRNVAWPLTVFDEFSSHCAAMKTDCPVPMCRLLWAISATPTEISKTLHGCNTKNPFKVLVGSHFKKAEDEIPALCESWMPKHWAWTPETYDRRTLRERIELLEGNAQVMLLTTFGQSVIEQVIDDVSLKMPRGVRLIVRSLNNADPYGRRARPHAFDIVPFEPPANCHSVYDLTAPSPKLAFATTSTVRTHVFVEDIDIWCMRMRRHVRWFPFQSYPRFVLVDDVRARLSYAILALMELDLNAALDPPTVIEYERCLRGDRYSQSALNQLKKKREQLNAYYGLQDHREPACPSPTKTGALVCTRCGSCVARESLTSSSWARLHYNSVTRTLRCPGCYYPGQLPSDLLFAEPDQPISVDEVDTYAAYNFPRALDGGGYANVFYITMAHHVLNRGSRRFVLFGDLPQVMPFLRDVFSSLASIAPTAYWRCLQYRTRCRPYTARFEQATRSTSEWCTS
ncbi:hypothetical protein CYMTET_40377 [Cymbomonas tetramitiformis]|uniref:Uncharacterized protein n=1 Tax=Cymbomonas tetramitiformis TaxID=36881 RepID=A0AAE0F3Q0_9CHLO|nr:hypothetical protein CYMTET_40377 [Cymbomonas tetramitiformis]